MKRALTHLLAASALCIGVGTASAQTPPSPPAAPPATTSPAPAADPYSWIRPAVGRMVSEGVWPELAGANLARNATRGDLDRAIGILTGTGRRTGSTTRVSVWTANVIFVRALGLETERLALNRLATADGTRLKLPRHFGSEVLVRELGMVHNHLAAFERYERKRGQSLRLGDLVGMLDRARGLSSWQLERMSVYQSLSLPAMTPTQRAVVQAALTQVGQPYVWGGDWPGRRSPWGAQATGGFDCSGLAWWAFKGSPAPRQMELGDELMGRTADQMAFERPAERVEIASLVPADLVFFGPRGPQSLPGTIEHEGIALGNGWMVHSSGGRGGVTVSNLATYWPSATAFGRRVSVVR